MGGRGGITASATAQSLSMAPTAKAAAIHLPPSSSERPLQSLCFQVLIRVSLPVGGKQNQTSTRVVVGVRFESSLSLGVREHPCDLPVSLAPQNFRAPLWSE